MFGFWGLRHCCKVIGNGDAYKGHAIVILIAMRLRHARKKHPDWQGKGKNWALGVIGAEYHEFENAVINETGKRQIDECLDIIAPGIRFLNGEHE